MRFRKGEWVRSVRKRSKGAFIGQIVDISQGEYVIRDAEKLLWLRTESELSPASPKKEAA